MFEEHLVNNQHNERMVLGANNHMLCDARLLAYTSICRPILEYADTVWDATQKSLVEGTENTEPCHLIKKLKG